MKNKSRIWSHADFVWDNLNWIIKSKNKKTNILSNRVLWSVVSSMESGKTPYLHNSDALAKRVSPNPTTLQGQQQESGLIIYGWGCKTTQRLGPLTAAYCDHMREHTYAHTCTDTNVCFEICTCMYQKQ